MDPRRREGQLNALVVAFVGVLAVARVAHAEPSHRVVLADPDPELRRSLGTTLAPWQLELVVDAVVPRTTTEAEARAIALDARFVVWRQDGDLVVFDRERGAAEHRDGKPGALDGPDAASAALTVKTLMRLPPPGELAGPMSPPAVSAPWLRAQVGVGSRIALGAETVVGARFAGAVLVRPWAALRVGLGAELGTSSEVGVAGFRGEWSDASVIALAAWTLGDGRWQIEPYAGAGLTRSRLDGTDMGVQRAETDVIALLRPGVWVRWRSGAFSIAADIAVVFAPGTPTYTKQNGQTEIFQVPGIGFTAGVSTALDFDL